MKKSKDTRRDEKHRLLSNWQVFSYLRSDSFIVLRKKEITTFHVQFGFER